MTMTANPVRWNEIQTSRPCFRTPVTVSYDARHQRSGRPMRISVPEMPGALSDAIRQHVEQAFSPAARRTLNLAAGGLVSPMAVAEWEGKPCAVTLLPEGCSLADYLRERAEIMPDQILEWGAQLAGGLAAAEQAGFYHGAISPHTVWIDSAGQASLLDLMIHHAACVAAEQSGVPSVETTPYYAGSRTPGHDAARPNDPRALARLVICLFTELKPGAVTSDTAERHLPAYLPAMLRHELLGALAPDAHSFSWEKLAARLSFDSLWLRSRAQKGPGQEQPRAGTRDQLEETPGQPQPASAAPQGLQIVVPLAEVAPAEPAPARCEALPARPGTREAGGAAPAPEGLQVVVPLGRVELQAEAPAVDPGPAPGPRAEESLPVWAVVPEAHAAECETEGPEAAAHPPAILSAALPVALERSPAEPAALEVLEIRTSAAPSEAEPAAAGEEVAPDASPADAPDGRTELPSQDAAPEAAAAPELTAAPETVAAEAPADEAAPDLQEPTSLAAAGEEPAPCVEAATDAVVEAALAAEEEPAPSEVAPPERRPAPFEPQERVAPAAERAGGVWEPEMRSAPAGRPGPGEIQVWSSGQAAASGARALMQPVLFWMLSAVTASVGMGLGLIAFAFATR